MKKVSELIGAELDYWVAKASGKASIRERHFGGVLQIGKSGLEINTSTGYKSIWPWDYSPSTNWAQGGAIMEREGITVEAIWPVSGNLPINSWHAERNSVHFHFGTTPLIAAMRCYVDSVFGYEVDDSETHHD